MSGLPPELMTPEVQALYQAWVRDFFSQLQAPPAMPQTPEQLTQALTDGLRSTFDSWAESEGEIRRNQDLRLQIRADTLRELRADGKTGQGYHIVEVACARTGLQTYVDAKYPGGKRVELRTLEAITEPESLASWLHAPAIIYHQPLITLENSPKFKRGYVFAGPRVEKQPDGEDYLVFQVLIDHPELVEGIRSGKYVEVSAGYGCLFVPKPGTYKGVPYDGLQVRIRINHLAFLPAGLARAGQFARVLRQDSNEAQFYLLYDSPISQGVFQMTDEEKRAAAAAAAALAAANQPAQSLIRVTLDSNISTDMAPDQAQLVQSALQGRDSQIATLKAQLATLEGEKTTLTARADSADQRKTELETENATLKASAGSGNGKKLLQAYEKARQYLPKDFKLDSLEDGSVTERAFQELALKARVPGRDFSKEDDKYVATYFDSLIGDAPPAARVGSGNPSANAQRMFDGLRPGQRLDGSPVPGAQADGARQDGQEPPMPAYLRSFVEPTQKIMEGKK